MSQPPATFAVDVNQYRLLDAERPVRLERQPMELLLMLATRRGELVTREEIVRTLWPDGTNVSEDQSINRVVRKLRIALRDDPDAPRFIETVVGKGYRFIGPIELRHAPAPQVGASAVAAVQGRRHTLSSRALNIGLATFGVIGWILYAISSSHRVALPEPLTAYAGDEQYPSWSPDGNQIAFAWNGEQRDNWDIYVKVVPSASAPLRLTRDPADDTMPAWSPDGRELAFERLTGNAFDVYLTSPLGGPERRIAEGLHNRTAAELSSPSWSPDGQWVVVADFDRSHQKSRILAISTRSDDTRTVASRSEPGSFQYPLIGPAGGTLAYEWCNIVNICDLYVTALTREFTAPGRTEQLTHDGHLARGLTWSADGRSLIYGDGLRLGLRRVSLGTHASETIAGTGGGMYPSASATGHRLAFVQAGWDIHLWRFGQGGTGSPESLLPSTLVDVNPQLSPDGTRIVFGSERAGLGRQIWVGQADASNVAAVTEPTGRAQGSPRWSQDSQWIAYDGQSDDGHRHVYVMDAAGGHRRRLTSDPSDESMPSWSLDNRFVYFGSTRTGRPEIWRMPFATGGTADQVTFAGGLASFAGGDGTSIFYAKSNDHDNPLYMKTLTGADETTVVKSVYRSDFVPVKGGVYYVSHVEHGRQDEFELCFLDLATATATILNRFEALDVVGLTVSPDRQTVVTSGVRPTAGYDLAWIREFR